MVYTAKASVDESSLLDIVQTKKAELANDIAAVRNLNSINNKVLLATKIRLWSKALDYKLYLSREQREKIWYALIDISGVYDNPKAPLLDKVSEPAVLVGTYIKIQKKVIS